MVKVITRARLGFFLVIVFLLSGALFACALRPDAPEAVVRGYFEALERGDQDKLLDTIAPDQRGSPILSISWFARGLLGNISFREMKYETLEKDAGSAHVKVTGKFRSLGMERDMNVVAKALKIRGKWYVSEPVAP